MRILGIETSCDETAAAVVEDGRRVRSSIVSSQVELHAPYGGVVPELASRAHVELINPVVDEALMEAGILDAGELDAVAACHGPGLAGGVVDRRSEDPVPGTVAYVEHQRVAAAREEAQERRLDGVRLEVQRRHVPVQVVDRREREATRPRDRLRRREADEQRADEPGTLRHRDRLDVVERGMGVLERRSHDRRHELEVTT